MPCPVLECRHCSDRRPHHQPLCGHTSDEGLEVVRVNTYEAYRTYEACRCIRATQSSAGSHLGASQTARRSASPRVSPSPSVTPAQNYRDRHDRSTQPRLALRPIAPQQNIARETSPQPPTQRVQPIAPRPSVNQPTGSQQLDPPPRAPPPLARQPFAPPAPPAAPQGARPTLPSIQAVTGINYYTVRQSFPQTQAPFEYPAPQRASTTNVDARNASQVNIHNIPNAPTQPDMTFSPPAASYPPVSFATNTSRGKRKVPFAPRTQWTVEEDAILLALHDLHYNATQIEQTGELGGREREAIRGRLSWIRNHPNLETRARESESFKNYSPPSQHPSAFNKSQNKRSGDDDDGGFGDGLGSGSQPLATR